MQDTSFWLGSLMFTCGANESLFTVQGHDTAQHTLVGPTLHIANHERGNFVFSERVGTRDLPRGGSEVTLQYISEGTPALYLLVTLRGYPHSPIVRMRYRFTASAPTTLTKHEGRDTITYLTLQNAFSPETRLTEIQLSHFDPVAHSYMPHVETRAADEVYAGMHFAGPIAIAHDSRQAVLLAYEHGADHPASFLAFHVDPARNVSLKSVKGNYYHGQPIGPGTAWETAWFEIALAPLGVDGLLRAYRHFFLHEISENAESRKPYLFYNTWNYQERNRYFDNKPYLESMHFERISAEIEVAHQLGIDVFVIDTGWYNKTGDWRVNTDRFPDGLKDIKRKLDSYNMKLGLWFNPTVAALTSDIFLAHPEYEMTHNGAPTYRAPVWETEESAAMCLASDYADAYIDEMVRLYDELGVTYFKWDGISQYGCDSALHHHGTANNTAEERAECYAYQMGLQMIRIVEEMSRRCPDVIVDFDITEGGRFVGLGFLAVGKYFLINNGPYFHDFDIPRSVKVEPDTINVFFYPGPARPRICRQNIKYDPIIPSVLFLTHYLPDPPALSQLNTLAALVLGGNGIWGDLLALSEEDIELLSSQLAAYKGVAHGVTEAYPRIYGFAGSSPEIHEKLDTASGAGLVAFFTVTPGSISHVTQPLTRDVTVNISGADSWEWLPDNRLKLTVQLKRNDARIVFVQPV